MIYLIYIIVYVNFLYFICIPSNIKNKINIKKNKRVKNIIILFIDTVFFIYKNNYL